MNPLAPLALAPAGSGGGDITDARSCDRGYGRADGVGVGVGVGGRAASGP